jgi:hypothetical protein
LEQQFCRFAEAPGKKVTEADSKKTWSAAARIKTQTGFEVLDRKFGLPGPKPQRTTSVPGSCRVRVEFQRTINQGNGRIDILLKVTECVGCHTENDRVITGNSKSSSSKINAQLAICFLSLAPSVDVQVLIAHRL